jgi:hypothetical protein
MFIFLYSKDLVIFSFKKLIKSISFIYYSDSLKTQLFSNYLPFYKSVHNKFFYFSTQIFLTNNLKYLKNYFYLKNNLFLKLLKFYGINVRIIKKLHQHFLLLRLAYSHLIFIKIPNFLLCKNIKKRYLLLSSANINYLNNFVFNLIQFKRIFKYKLIGIKMTRSYIKLKSGKKKSL